MVYTTRFVRRPRRPQRPGKRAAPPGCHPEERQAEPPPDPGQSRSGSSRPCRNGWPPSRPPPPSPSCRPSSTRSPAYYNTRRPHRSLPHRATPAIAYAARPKAVPGDRAADTHDRVRTDIIGTTGTVTLRTGGRSTTSASAGPTPEPTSSCSSRTCDIRIINAATGELLRELTLDPARNYQPTGRPPGPTPGTPRKRQDPEP